MKTEWLVIGGGIHGVHLAARLIAEAHVNPKQLRIVDPGQRLLQRWRTCTETTGMRHLRSPAVHHLDVEPWSLRIFGTKRNAKKSNFAAPYSRPSLALFNAHCDRVIDEFSLDDLHISARAVRATRSKGFIAVELSNEQVIETRNIVLAVGMGEQPHYPDWLPENRSNIHHVFAPGFDEWPQEKERVVVVGGGISAAQIALRLMKEGHEVHLMSRHELRQHQFDSDPGWLGPKHMNGFEKVRDVAKRRALIAEARHKGSVPPNVRRAIKRAVRLEKMTWHLEEVEHIEVVEGDSTVHFRSGRQLKFDRMLLSTGFSAHRPGGSFVDELVETFELPCAPCGYPILDHWLRWDSNIFASGPLAELELGPTARNIAGARRAADRLIAIANSARRAA